MLGLPKDFVVRMERAHIRCIPFNPVVPLLSLVMNHRDHRKIVVIDGKVAYTGGINLADEYINAITRFGYWKDAGLRIEGAAVWNFTVMFLDFWNAFRPFEQDYSTFRPQLAVLPDSDGVVQPYADSPLDEEPVAETVYLDILAQSQQYVYFIRLISPSARKCWMHCATPPSAGWMCGWRCRASRTKAGVPAEPLVLSAPAAGGGAHLRVHPGLSPRQVLRQR